MHSPRTQCPVIGFAHVTNEIATSKCGILGKVRHSVLIAPGAGIEHAPQRVVTDAQVARHRLHRHLRAERDHHRLEELGEAAARAWPTAPSPALSCRSRGSAPAAPGHGCRRGARRNAGAASCADACRAPADPPARTPDRQSVHRAQNPPPDRCAWPRVKVHGDHLPRRSQPQSGSKQALLGRVHLRGAPVPSQAPLSSRFSVRVFTPRFWPERRIWTPGMAAPW